MGKPGTLNRLDKVQLSPSHGNGFGLPTRQFRVHFVNHFFKISLPGPSIKNRAAQVIAKGGSDRHAKDISHIYFLILSHIGRKHDPKIGHTHSLVVAQIGHRNP